MKVAFVFVLYQTPEEEVLRIKKELRAMGVNDADIYFTDNTADNKGYAYGVNQGITRALSDKAEVVVVANTDISFQKLSLADITNGVKHFDVCGFRCEQNGETFYGGRLDSWRMSGGLIYDKPSTRYTACDFVSGSFMILTRNVIDEVGLFDESYFMYYEDVDYCIRATKTGFTVGVDSERAYEHFETSSENPDKAYFLAKNRFKILLAHGSFMQKMYEVVRFPKTCFQESNLIRRLIKKDPFFVNYFSLNISSVANKVLNFLLFIVLVNNLSLHEYGIYTLVWAHVTLLNPLTDLGTTSYGLIYGNKSTRHIFKLFSLRFYVSLLVFILTVLLAFLFHYNLNVLGYIILLSFVIFSNALSGSFLILTSVIERVYLSSVFSFIFNLIMISFLIAITYLYRDISYVFLTVFIFYNIYSVSNIMGIQRVLSTQLNPQAEERKIGAFIRENLRIRPAAWWAIFRKSYIFVLIGLFASLYFKGDIFLLNYYKGEEAVGIYSAGYKFFEALMFFAASYNITAAPAFVRLKQQGKELLIKRVKRDLVFLSALGIGVSVSFYLLAPYILPFFLKGTFLEAIAVTRIVIFALPLILLISVFLNLLYIYQKSFIVVYIFMAQMVVNIGLNIMFIPRYSFIGSSYITVFSELINLIILLFVTIKVIKNSH